MSNFISDNLTAIILALIGLLAVGILIKIRVTNRRSRDDKSTKVNQSNNKVGGDQAGRDIKKR